jgi:putative transposase
VNRKRVRRIWRQEGLQVKTRKRRRRAGRRAPGHVAPSRPNQVWAMVFQFDDISRGRRIKILNVTDEFTREPLAGTVARHITAKDTVAVLQQVVSERGAPTHIRCDNGPEFIAKALQRWCSRRGSATSHIEPGAHGRISSWSPTTDHLRKELLDLELLDSVLEAQVLIDDWREDYNTYRPHQSLGYLTPAEFARRWMDNEGRASQQVDR